MNKLNPARTKWTTRSCIDGIRTWYRHSVERLWGYDFFISYHWVSGGTYAVLLAEKLREKGFDCFLDRSEFAVGDEWEEEARRALRRTQRLVVIATYAAIFDSKPVETELRIFTEKSRPIIPISFIDPGVEGSRFADAPTGIELATIESSSLGYLPESKLDIRDHVNNLAIGPPDSVADAIVRTFNVLRRRTIRRFAVAVAMMLLSAATAVAIWNAIIANRERASAERRFEQVQGVTSSMVTSLQGVIEELPGAIRHRERLVTDALPYLDLLIAENPEDEDTLELIAIAYIQLGDALGHPIEPSMGDAYRAKSCWNKADSVLERLIQHSRETDHYVHKRTLIAERLALLDLDLGRIEDANTKLVLALTTLDPIAERLAEDWMIQRDRIRYLGHLGNIQRRMKDFDKASLLCDRAISLARASLHTFDGRVMYSDLAHSLVQSAQLSYERGNTQPALDMLDEAISLREMLLKDEPYDANNRVAAANQHSMLGDWLADQFDFEKSLAESRIAVKLVRPLQRREPENELYTHNLARQLESYGAALAKLGKWKKAVSTYKESAELRLILYEVQPDKLEYALDYTISRMGIADAMKGRGNLSPDEVIEVEKHYRESLAKRKELYAAVTENPKFLSAVYKSERSLGRFLLEFIENSADESVLHLKEAVKISEQMHDLLQDDFELAKDSIVTLFFLGDAILASDGSTEGVLEIQSMAITRLQELRSRNPNRPDLLKTEFVAEQRLAKTYLLIADQSENKTKPVELAIECLERSKKACAELIAMDVGLLGLQEELDSITSAISECRKRLESTTKPAEPIAPALEENWQPVECQNLEGIDGNS